MSRGPLVQLLFVEEDASVWPRAEAFFQQQLGLVEAQLAFHARRRLPERMAGFDLVSLDGRGLISALLEREGLRSDLRRTAIVNLHTNDAGTTYAQLRRLLAHPDGRNPSADGLWVFPQTWMAPWFREPLDFPELGLVAAPRPRVSPDRTPERHSVSPLMVLTSRFAPAR